MCRCRMRAPFEIRLARRKGGGWSRHDGARRIGGERKVESVYLKGFNGMVLGFMCSYIVEREYNAGFCAWERYNF